MKKFLRPGVAVFALLVLMTVRAESEPSAAKQTSGAWGTGGRYQELYEKGTRATFEGKVLRTEDLMPLNAVEPGLQLRLRGEKGEMGVHVGPKWFVMERDLLFTKGEPVVVVGVTIRWEGKPAIVAQEIRWRDRKVILRELTGAPVWAGSAGHKVPE